MTLQLCVKLGHVARCVSHEGEGNDGYSNQPIIQMHLPLACYRLCIIVLGMKEDGEER